MLSRYIPLDKAAAEKFEKLYELVLASPVNVTAIKSREDFRLKHLLDSVYFFHLYPHTLSTMADLGSGGGFPGLALAVLYPEWRVTLVDSVGKKCRFMREAAAKLCLPNVTVVNVRGEDYQGHTFDLITARGVGSVKQVLEHTFHWGHKRSIWLMYKGEKAEGELAEAKDLLANRGLESEIVRVEKPFMRSYVKIYFKDTK